MNMIISESFIIMKIWYVIIRFLEKHQKEIKNCYSLYIDILNAKLENFANNASFLVYFAIMSVVMKLYSKWIIEEMVLHFILKVLIFKKGVIAVNAIPALVVVVVVVVAVLKILYYP